MKVTILSDNKVVEVGKFKAEWGFSALIETDRGEVILFDTGQSVAFENFVKLEKEFPAAIVLSHGHYDHTSGMLPFLRDSVKLYAHPDVFLPRFQNGRYIGIPYRKEYIESLAEIVEVREPTRITKDVWITGEIPRVHKDSALRDSYILRNGKKEIDKIADDQAIAVKTEGGVALLLGCCHSGLENTVEWAEEVAGDDVKYLIGGMHMISYREEEILKIAKKLDVELLAPCHCTGFKAETLLQKVLGDKYLLIGSGSEIEI